MQPVAPRAPLLQSVVGRLSAAAYAAESLVLAAAEDVQRAHAARESGHPDEAHARAAGLSAAKLKIVVDELALRATGELFDAGGASATRAGLALDRHWRNVRTLVSHNPTPYKAQAVGAHVLLGAPLPANSYF